MSWDITCTQPDLEFRRSHGCACLLKVALVRVSSVLNFSAVVEGKVVAQTDPGWVCAFYSASFASKVKFYLSIGVRLPQA